MKHLQASEQAGFRVIAGTSRSQAATMVLSVGESTGGPTNAHKTSDQWLFIISGEGEATVDGQKVNLTPGSLLLIEAEETHEIANTGTSALVTLSIYAPPEY